MKLISKDYLALQRELHETGEYGRKGDRWAEKVESLYKKYNCTSLLDYGAGQMRLQRELGARLNMKSYDPAMPKIARPPDQADMVCANDVMEHIEPECIEDVMAHIRSLTRVVFFSVIGMEPAMKFLGDGRNAHVLLRSRDWWLDLYGKHKFAIDDVTEKGARSLIVVARPC